MQTTINLSYVELTRDLTRARKDEAFDCRVAAMARMTSLLDAGVPFVVTHTPHDVVDAHPVRHVTLWDEAALHHACPRGWRSIEAD